MINNEIGYIKVTRFAATTYDEFKKAVTELKSQGMKKLVLDLQSNPGAVEKYARERYLLRREGEEVYLFEDTFSNNAAQKK